MIIRRYHSDDFAEMMKLHREVLIKENVYRGTGVWENDLYDIHGHYFNNAGVFLIGVAENRIIAMGALRRISEITAEIVRMRVHPDYQGKGLGYIILNKLEIFANKNHYKELVLETDDRLKYAIKLYRSSGNIFWKNEELNGFICSWYRKYNSAN